MRRLHHFVLSPFCRKVRLVLGEKKLACELIAERPWERRPEFLALHSAGRVPLLIEDSGAAVADSGAIAEYLEEIHPEPPLMPQRPVERAEVRRLVALFDQDAATEATNVLLREKVLKRFGWGTDGAASPDIAAIRTALDAARKYLALIGELSEKRGWMAGALSLADFTAAAHISVIDYLGDVAWETHGPAREWYARVKSRPCFRPLLADQLPGMPPPRHYANLDF